MFELWHRNTPSKGQSKIFRSSLKESQLFFVGLFWNFDKLVKMRKQSKFKMFLNYKYEKILPDDSLDSVYRSVGYR